MTFPSRLNIIFMGVAVIGSMGLLISYGFEYFLDLKPCILCLYERIPYAIALLIGFLGWRRPKLFPKAFLMILFITFLGSSLLSFYHMGIERGFFSPLAACGGQSEIEAQSVDQLEELISKTSLVPCDVVHFRFLTLSLVEYNLLFSLCLTLLFGVILFQLNSKKHQ